MVIYNNTTCILPDLDGMNCDGHPAESDPSSKRIIHFTVHTILLLSVYTKTDIRKIQQSLYTCVACLHVRTIAVAFHQFLLNSVNQ